jgi:hypothetical protein
LNFLDRFSKKYSNIEFNDNPTNGRQVVPCGQADGQTNRHDEANGCIPQILRIVPLFSDISDNAKLLK